MTIRNLKKNVPTILCYGECNIDIITPINEIPVKGGCTFSTKVEINIGGSMLNTAIALRALNLPVLIISKIGNDIFGDMVLQYINDSNINTENMVRSDYPTGLAISLVEPDGEKRWISIRRNAADIHIVSEDIQGIDIPDILFISGVEIVEGIESRETAIKFAKAAKKMGKSVFLDPNIRVPEWELPDDVRDAFERILPSTGVLLLNEKELEMLGGSKNIKIAARTIIDKGTRCIWLKMGSKGSCYITKSKKIHFEPSSDKAVDTSGAGDAFNAAVIFALINNFSPLKTGVFANMYAGYTISRLGTTSALPAKGEVADMIYKAEQYMKSLNLI